MASQLDIPTPQPLVCLNLSPATASGPEPLPAVRRYRLLKGTVDFVLAVVLFVLTLPLVLLAALLVKLTSRGPVFYAQTRLGLDGRPFRIHKLRTMYKDCEKDSGVCWASPGDPRVTPVGSFLRRTHLDELPQLWNVLRGEMSLVGPRPERPEFIPRLEGAIPRYRERLQIRPGVTGLAQVQLPGDTDLDSVRRKLVYDLYYIEHLSLWLDLKLIGCTACKVFHVPFRMQRRLFRVPAAATVENPGEEGEVSTEAMPESPAKVLQPELA
jgi:lipopolysaccharide/colanic/teichoic acid biosynthesis glycosyltransferase